MTPGPLLLYIRPMELDFARRFTDEWLDAWNRHDIDAILSHFHDDVVFTSPVALRIVGDSDGYVRGKDNLRAYWTEGLRRSGDLHFTLDSIYVGVDTLVINYRNQAGGRVNEVLVFKDSLVIEGHGTYETV
jgi:ketosteroid isomerase-like protein